MKTLKEKIEEGFSVLDHILRNYSVEEESLLEKYNIIKSLIKQEPNPFMQSYYDFRINRIWRPK